MSIAALAIRLAARRLIEGATIAESKVYDSAISSLDELVSKEGAKPLIIVSTEDERVSPKGRDVLAGDRSIDLIIEAVLGSATNANSEEGAVNIPATDAGLELSLALMSRQIMRALYGSSGPWASIFRKLAPQVGSVLTRRGASASGTRFAAKQIILTVEPLAEPPFGVAIEGVWLEFIDALEADEAYQHFASAVRSAIVGEPIPEWRRAARSIGLTDSEARGIGIFGPYLPPEEPVEWNEVEIEGIGVIDQAEIDRNLPDE
ncbi:hypothetical protein [Pararhizobium haloflavum]|uniref:hypothetical protein n=1 Tax=Pararhizobium haloflavum TaxID=2037914 RepID=UPI000C197CD4|nr:hypothetical protein [Pararhizobium haloflavum]